MHDYVSGMYAAGIEGPVDDIALHLYDDTPENAVGLVEDTRSIMNANGDSATPIWATEWGWASAGKPNKLRHRPGRAGGRRRLADGRAGGAARGAERARAHRVLLARRVGPVELRPTAGTTTSGWSSRTTRTSPHTTPSSAARSTSTPPDTTIDSAPAGVVAAGPAEHRLLLHPARVRLRVQPRRLRLERLQQPAGARHARPRRAHCARPRDGSLRQHRPEPGACVLAGARLGGGGQQGGRGPLLPLSPCAGAGPQAARGSTRRGSPASAR